MTASGILAVVHVEFAKVSAQWKTRVLLAACVAGPFAFAVAMRVQSSLPSDTLFGRMVKESGFAVPLVILGFAALWTFAVLTSVVAGDLFSAEDRHGTWSTVLTRSRSRAEIFTGKVVTAFGFSSAAVIALALSSIAAGALVIGRQPLVNLSGVLVPPSRALLVVALAWVSVLPPAFAFTALALLLSVTTRSSVAGVGLPVVAALIMQVSTLLDGPDLARRALMTSGFDAWHGLLTEPRFHRPLVFATTISAVYIVVFLTVAWRALRRRDIGG
jgi:ABC-2 type transport system permease protein